MITLGVDLFSQAKKTAACLIEWRDGVAKVTSLTLGATDQAILDLARPCDAIGIDAPFGWPRPFVELVAREAPVGGGSVLSWSDSRRNSLMFRLTDVRVREVVGIWPLSVSADKLGVVAMRCAGLLDTLGVADRSGDGKVFEVYPAAALGIWGFPYRGYKGSDGTTNLRTLFQRFKAETPWLEMAAGMMEQCLRSDDVFDAMISALVVRTAKLGLVVRPSDNETGRAQIEGWITLPLRDSLAKLALPDRVQADAQHGEASAVSPGRALLG
jgi:predicted nuclease with RNAse H fold